MTNTSRRRVLQCMGALGAGIAWTVAGGVPRRLGPGEAHAATGGFTFVQVSDSHIGFHAEPNANPAATLREALTMIAAMPSPPAFVLHTGDVSHLSKPDQFDAAAEIMKEARVTAHYIPGEHDVIGDDGAAFYQRFAATPNSRWYSFDHGDVHFVALVNVLGLKSGGMGSLGADQVDWLAQDLKGKSASTPIVVFAHMPLWPLYPEWGWGTDDAAAALSQLKRFGSVTVLNGHVHQVMQKVEGNVKFQTARSTAYPQPAPGDGPGPGPLKVSEDRLKQMLGLRTVTVERAPTGVVIADTALA